MFFAVGLMSSPDSYLAAVRGLKEALKFGIDPSLEGVLAFSESLGRPQDDFDSIQIAGTNGKSSTSRYIAGILQGQGRRTGLFTSPDLSRYTERVEIDGQVVTDDVFAEAVHTVLGESSDLERPLTEFSLLTVASMLIFQQQRIDIASLEVGLGGRWDSTSIVDPQVSVITGIGLDHVHILGDTLVEIAGEKAGVISPSKPVVLGPGTQLEPSVLEVFISVAERGNSPVYRVRQADGHGVSGPATEPESPFRGTGEYCILSEPAELGDELKLEIEGIYATYTNITAVVPFYQAQNIATAVVACEVYLGHALDGVRLAESIRDTRTPGRFELLRQDPLLLIDASHNPQSISVFWDSLQPLISHRHAQPVLLLAVLADKDAEGIVEAIAPKFKRVHVTETGTSRALPVSELACIVRDVTGREPEGVHEDVASALLKLDGEDVVACGSITLAGEIRSRTP